MSSITPHLSWLLNSLGISALGVGSLIALGSQSDQINSTVESIILNYAAACLIIGAGLLIPGIISGCLAIKAQSCGSGSVMIAAILSIVLLPLSGFLMGLTVRCQLILERCEQKLGPFGDICDNYYGTASQCMTDTPLKIACWTVSVALLFGWLGITIHAYRSRRVNVSPLVSESEALP